MRLSLRAASRLAVSVCLGFLAFGGTAPAALADTVSGKGFFNGKRSACNYSASAGNWHVISSAFSVEQNMSPAISGFLEPNYLMMVYDPLTQPGFRLQDVMGYEKRWSSWRGTSSKERKFLNYTGQWPFRNSMVGENYRVGREPIVTLFMDSFSISLQITVPPDYRMKPRPLPISLNGTKASFTDTVFDEAPTLMSVKIGDAAPHLLASYARPLRRNRFLKFRGKVRISNAQDQLSDTHFVSVRIPTYNKTTYQLRQQLRRGQKPDLAGTPNAAVMLSYFLNSSQSETDEFKLSLVEKGQVVYETSLPGIHEASKLLNRGLAQYGSGLLNAECW